MKIRKLLHSVEALGNKQKLFLLFLLAILGCGGPPEFSTAERAEFRRHLHQGLDQMRYLRFEAAEAEFGKCMEINPTDRDLRFHWARLNLSRPESNKSEALVTLGELVAEETTSIRSLRLLMSYFQNMGRETEVQLLREQVLARYGEMGALELAEARVMQGKSGDGLDLSSKSPQSILSAVKAGNLSDFDKFVTIVMRIAGFIMFYDPVPAMNDLERMLDQYPDLAALRIRVAYPLKFTRYPRTSTNLRTSTDSQWSLEVAQLLYEQALDLLPVQSLLALEAQFQLASLALDMGDFDEARKKFNIVLNHPYSKGPKRSETLWLRGVAEYRQERFREAISSFQEAIRIRSDGRILWMLRLAQEAVGVSGSPVFPLRPDTANPKNPTRLDFVDIAPQLGVNKTDGAGPSAWGDFDNDGDFDLFVSGCDTFSILYRNDGERFTDVSREAGLEFIDPAWGSTFVDYDNDGDPDLHLARNGWNGPGPNSLYENNGDGTFTEVTERAGLGDPGSTFVHAWADFDRDGFLDLLNANGVRMDGSVNRLYHNNGDGTFTDITETAGLLETPGTRTIGFAVGDYDKDGWPDIFINGHRNELNRLYHNKGNGTFEELAKHAGVEGSPKQVGGYVAFFLDYDNDTWLDILLTKLANDSKTYLGMSAWYLDQPPEVKKDLLTQAPELYRNNKDGTFTNVSKEAGFRYPHGIMGAGVADLDNDGFLDVYFATGAPPLHRLEPNIFYRNTGKGEFADLTWVTNLGHLGKGHGITFFDYKQDGKLDIYAPQGGFVHGDLWPNAFYRNETQNGYHWLQLQLQGERSNRDAVGTHLTLRAGPLTLYREITLGGGFGVSDEPIAHFGLGRQDIVNELIILWPSGLEQNFKNISVDQRLFLKESDSSLSTVPVLALNRIFSQKKGKAERIGLKE